MNNALKKIFYKNAAWNTLDALGTQSLVVLHHVLLQVYAGPQLHGIIGTLFSILYMTVLVANMGFDFSCVPFMNYYTADQKKWRNFITTKLIPQCIWICFCACLFFIGIKTFKLSDKTTTVTALILAATFINESIKKTTKVFLQLLFFTRITALIECIGMIIYALSVWGWYYNGYGISVISSFFILYLVSTAQMLCLLYALYRWYKQAPAYTAIDIPAQMTTRIIKSRFWISIQRGVEQLFSNNFLVPFFAVSCGLTYASYFKIISSIARWVSLFGDKTFGVTSLMLLSKTPALIQQTIPFINRIIGITIGVMLPLLVTISTSAGYYCSVQSTALIIVCSLLIVLRFIDMTCIVYERWLLLRERMHYTVIFLLLTTLCIGMIISYTSIIPLYVVSMLIAARIIQLGWYMLLFKNASKKNEKI